MNERNFKKEDIISAVNCSTSDTSVLEKEETNLIIKEGKREGKLSKIRMRESTMKKTGRENWNRSITKNETNGMSGCQTEDNDNDNDNDTLREVPHWSDEGLALQAKVSGPWPHKKRICLTGEACSIGKVQEQTVVDRV